MPTGLYLGGSSKKTALSGDILLHFVGDSYWLKAEVRKIEIQLFDCAQFVSHHLLFTSVYWRLWAQFK